MRQSKMTKITALMLSMVMITSVFVGNTLSRYVTSVSSTDNARVAVWGINGEETTMNLFDTKYIKDGKKIAEANNKADKIIAPGTSGEAPFNIINFEQDVPPEVAYQVSINLDDSEMNDLIKNNPSIQWKLDDKAWGTWDNLKTSILSLAGNESGIHTYGPGEFATAFQGTQTHKIAWQWIIDSNEPVVTQVCDEEDNCQNVTMTSQEYNTYLGNLAVDGPIEAVVKVSITATQTDYTGLNMLDGAVRTLNLNDVQPISYRSVANIDTLENVTINGNVVNPDNYEVKEGSTIITFKPEYLQNFEQGSYDVSINSNDIIAEGKLLVNADTAIVHNGTIPVGGTYYQGIKLEPGGDFETGNFYGATVYKAGDKFPEPQKGDAYVYGDYEYRYNMKLYEYFLWTNSDSQDGWSAVAVDKNKTSYTNTLTSIAGEDIVNMDYTFYQCNKMIEAPIISNKVKTLVYTFSSCTSLIKAPVIHNGAVNLENTFFGCNSLKEVPIIPDSVKNMRWTFSSCDGLENVVLTANGALDMYGIFTNCKNLKEALIISDSVENLGYAFSNCEKLTTVTAIPDTVKQMDELFYGTPNITGTIEINANPTNYDSAFYGTTKSIILTGTSDVLNDIAQTSSGNNITIKPSGENINNPLVHSDTIPEGGIYYQNIVMDGPEDSVVGYYEGATVYEAGNKFPELKIGDVYVYGGYEYRYKEKVYFDGETWNSMSEDGWGVRVLDETLTSYGDILYSINGKNIVNMNNTFDGCSNMKIAPVIPDTVTSLVFTFTYCTSLIEAPVIPDSVIDMERTFWNCTSLIEAPIIPDNVTDMAWTFYGCTNLKTVHNIPSKVSSMDFAFEFCSNLTGTIEFNANPTDYEDIFLSTAKPIVLTGSSTMLNEIAASYDNVTVASN